ncbi:MAG: tetratricopeptide repeat protein [candidate division Zixibacteria bacterium]|nr:tetratricopeptide repeat protein [candidate division Zixibacteria bacterium]
MMNRPEDARFEHLLHAYELGLLSDEERQEFELLLMNSEDYFQEALESEKTSQLIKYDPEIRSLIRHRAEEMEKTEAARTAAGGSLLKKRWPALVPVSIAAIIIFFLLIFKDWRVDFRPQDEVMATENLLAVMYFDNLSDPEDTDRTGEIITNLLITDLSESQYLQVVSSQRLYDILKQLGREGSRKITPDIAGQVAEKASAKWMVLGSIIKEGRQQVIVSQLIDTRSGNTIASEKITAAETESIFSLVDRLTKAIKEDIPLLVNIKGEADPQVADVTTQSPEAYRYYIEGTDLYNKFYTREALLSFEKALTYDSTFAMVHYYLAKLKDRFHIRKALQYSHKASDREKYYINALAASSEDSVPKAIHILQELTRKYPYEKEAFYNLGNYFRYEGDTRQALDCYFQSIKIDPLYKLSYNIVAYIYNSLGNFDSTLWAINKYIEIAPDEANPYDSRAEIYALNGRLDEAIQSYKKALEIKPDFYTSLSYLGIMYVYNQEYEKADSCFRILLEVENTSIRAAGKHYLVYIPTYQGRFITALKQIDSTFKADSLQQVKESGTYCYIHAFKGLIYDAIGKTSEAVEALKKALEIRERLLPRDKTLFSDIYVQMLLKIGEFQKAREITDELHKRWEDSLAAADAYWYSEAMIEYSRGNYDRAIDYLEKARQVSNSFPAGYMLARAYLEENDLEKAVDNFENLVKKYTSPRMGYCIWSLECHYYLGLAYERSNWYEKAAEQYEKYLSILNLADENILHIPEARERLKRLRNKS